MITPDPDLHDRIRAFWDVDADTYDLAAGHAVSHPALAAAWRATLARHLPPPGAAVLDVGAGTGAISLLLADLGYRVTALDLSPGMLERARRKAVERGLEIEFVVGPATEPPPGPYEAVVERHVLWTLPDPVAALAAWRVAAPGGRLVLYEGFWGGADLLAGARRLALRAARAALQAREVGHHSEYEPAVRARLPLSGGMTADAVLATAARAGWRRARLERLRDVEWAERLLDHPVIGWLSTAPRFAVLLEA